MKRALGIILWVLSALGMWRLLGGGTSGSPGELPMLLASLVFLVGLRALGAAGFAMRFRKDRSGITRMQWWLACLGFGLAVLIIHWTTLAARMPAQAAVQAWGGWLSSAQRKSSATSAPAAENTSAWLQSDSARRALPRKTNIKPGRKPEVFLRIEDATQRRRFEKRPLHVLAMTFDRYADSAWEIAPARPGDRPADAAGIIALDPDAPREGGLWHTVVISSEANQRTPLVTLPAPTHVQGVARLENWAGDVHLLPSLPEGHTGYRYRARSLPLYLEDIAERPARNPAPGTPPAATSWLELPQGESAARIAQLARQVAGGQPPEQALRRIRDYLRKNHRYSLSTTNPRNLDPLENFLFEEKAGHCEYFASAGALMARACGIPSRVCYGWAGGTWYEQADWFVFRADEAHAWVEAWIDGHGWAIVDPTPPEALGASRQRVSREAPPPLPDQSPEAQDLPEPGENAATGSFPWLATSLSVLIPGLWIAALKIRPRHRASARMSSVEPWRDAAAGHYWDAWISACRREWSRPAWASSTLRQQLARWESKPEFSADLLRYHYAVRYHGEPRNPRVERDLKRRIETWAAALRE